MKKIYLALATALAFIGFSVSPIMAYAEESVNAVESSEIVTSEEVVEEVDSVENTASEEAVEEDSGIIPKTEGSEWFDENILPIIINYGAGILAMATVALLALKKLKNVIQLFKDALVLLGIANNKVESTDEEVRILREEMDKFKQSLVENLKEVLTDKVDDIDEVVHKILDVEEIAYESNPVLVGNGTAKKISEVIHK
jgi:hypothetical protein